MRPSVEAPAEKPRIFISYARADGSALAEELVVGLEIAGFEPYLDRRDIAAAEDWEARLGGLIQSADTVVFILSPAAVKSDRCAWEVDRATELGKQVIPVEDKPVPEAEVPERLRRLNYIFFREGQSFARPLADLARALRQDVEWIRSTRASVKRPPAGRPGPGQAAARPTTCCCAATSWLAPRPGPPGGRKTRRRSRRC